MSLGRAAIRYTAVLFAATISVLTVSQPVMARGDEVCSDLRVSVRVGRWRGNHDQQMIYSTSTSPGRKVPKGHSSVTFVANIEYDYEIKSELGLEKGVVQKEGKGMIYLSSTWGSFSQAQSLFTPGPVKNARVVNAYCIASGY